MHTEKNEPSWKFIISVGILLLCIRIFFAEPFLVSGTSMQPTFETGDYLIVDELSYKFEKPKRDEVVVFKPPYDTAKHLIKRIIGLPGETISVKGPVVTITTIDNKTIVLNEPYITFQSDKEATYTLSDSEYFVMGDNRSVSYDSRSWGPLPAYKITGRALLRLYPFNEIGIFPGGYKNTQI